MEKLICLLSYIIYNYNSIPSTSLSIIVLQVKLASSRVYISKIPSPTAYPILARAVLNGTVRNVVDFGAFIDIGIKNDGLVHISKISNKRVKNASDLLTVGDIVKVKVIGIDKDKGRVSLSMRDVSQDK